MILFPPIFHVSSVYRFQYISNGPAFPLDFS
jgi:hypothetical protein